MLTHHDKEALKKLKQHQQMREHDNAFLNSFLAYGVYTSRAWTLEASRSFNVFPVQKVKTANEIIEDLKSGDTSTFHKGLLAIAQKVAKENLPELKNTVLTGAEGSTSKLFEHYQKPEDSMTLRKAYEVYTAQYIRKTFEAVDLNVEQGLYTSQTYGYTTEVNCLNGDYEALNNLARAGVFRSKNPDGTFTLHLSFRGTDTNARPFMDFVAKAYSDMSAYYDAFKPLEKAVLEYAKDPANKISSLHISGHSLGGTMVQEFFRSREVRNCNIEMKGYTYGAPGNAKKMWHNLGPGLYHGIVHKKFKQIIMGVWGTIAPINYHPNDERIQQYRHFGDLIPKAGWFGYKSSGEAIKLKDYSSSNERDELMISGTTMICSKTPEFSKFSILTKAHEVFIKQPLYALKKALTFNFHDMLRYIRNIDHHMEDILVKHPDLSESAPHYNEFETYKKHYQKATRQKYDQITKNLVGEIPRIKLPAETMNAIAKVRAESLAKTVNRDLAESFKV